MTAIYTQEIVFEKNEKGNHLKEWNIVLKDEKEALVRRNQAPSVCFNPYTIDDIVNPKISLEETLKNKKKLTSKERTQLNHINEVNKKQVDEDIKQLSLRGPMFHVKTKKAKDLQILMLLQKALTEGKTNLVIHIYFKLLNRTLECDTEPYQRYLARMNDMIDKMDIIEHQFVKDYNRMPPLDRTEFILDDWQKQTIEYIKNKNSAIVMCPTSSGKTIVSSYVVTQAERILYVVPTDALAYQVGSYLTQVSKEVIPILTDTSIKWLDGDKNHQFFKSSIIVGTPKSIETILPFIDINFGYVVFDEIHNLNGEDGDILERIIKFTADIPFLALSATIGNLDELHKWWQSFTKEEIKIISHTGRFFNLQDYTYINNELKTLSPLSMLTLDDFKNKSVLEKNLEMTPVDVWNLYKSLSKFDLNDLDAYKYFSRKEHISLQRVKDYSFELLNFMVNNVDNENMSDFINSLTTGGKLVYDVKEKFDIYEMLFKLKENDKLPAIMFELDSNLCLKLFYNLLDKLERRELRKYPKHYVEQEKKFKEWEKWMKINEKKLNSMTEKQMTKTLKENSNREIPVKPTIGEPHEEFILSKTIQFTEDEINEHHDFIKKFITTHGDEKHPLIRALWRGFGIYCKGLPSNYLRLVQQLAQQKKLSLVFSDKELVFGVSMPFKSAIIYNDTRSKVKLDPLLNLQMAGRAGRRGLDKEGNVIYVNFDWTKLKELCTAELPKIIGKPMNSNVINLMNILKFKNLNPAKLLTNTLTYDEDDKKCENFMINTLKDDIYYDQLLWNLRYYDKSSRIINLIIPFVERMFYDKKPDIEKNQIELANMLSHFICLKETDIDTLDINKSYDEIYDLLQDNDVVIDKNRIENKLYKSVSSNSLIEANNLELKKQVWEFGDNVKLIQNYFYLKNNKTVKIFGKLFTRIWWIYNSACK